MRNVSKIKGITVTALFTAIIFVTTSFVKFPIALGYVHVGDVFILLGCFMLSPVYAVIAAAIGSMFADLLAGFAIYMPVTFFAKGLMALIASLIYYKKTDIIRFISGAIASSIVMVACYFVFEGFIYGWGLAAANLPMQFIQPGVAVAIGGAMIFTFKKVPYFMSLKENIAINTRKRVPKTTKNGLKDDENK